MAPTMVRVKRVLFPTLSLYYELGAGALEMREAIWEFL